MSYVTLHLCDLQNVCQGRLRWIYGHSTAYRPLGSYARSSFRVVAPLALYSSPLVVLTTLSLSRGSRGTYLMGFITAIYTSCAALAYVSGCGAAPMAPFELFCGAHRHIWRRSSLTSRRRHGHGSGFGRIPHEPNIHPTDPARPARLHRCVSESVK